MEIIGVILGCIAITVVVLAIMAGVYTFLEAVYNALTAVPKIPSTKELHMIYWELTKIRKLLEKEEDKL